MAILEVNNLKKVYVTRFGAQQVHALTNVSFSVEKGEFVAVMGESGSGKTTLLNILATLDKPTSGEVIIDGTLVTKKNLGFVFQDFNLLDTLSLKDNILLPLVLSGMRFAQMRARLTPLARKLGIETLLEKFPYEVSGGQKQRVAIARALITDPQLLLADEPTGALDSRAADELMRLFESVNAEGQTIVMVTHSLRAASRARRVLFIKDGEVFHQLYRASLSTEEFYQRISDALTLITTGGAQNA